jgi:acetolactate synthase-1/2/3 large subunit
LKLSDYIWSFIKSKGIDAVFYLPGGGCMHLVDSLGTSGINPVALLHEQAVAVACESYANTTGIPGAALVTTGPGGTNSVTGVLAAYLDSSPCFMISGQVKTADLKSRYGVRSLGSQEADIVSIVASITKYAVMVTDKNSIRYHLEYAWHMMTSGRKGPVWLDIPLDIQAADIEPDSLSGYTLNEKSTQTIDVSPIISALNTVERPLLIAGNGLASCKAAFFELTKTLQIPVIPSWKAMDYIPNTHPLYAGRIGGMGDRPGNLAMQNADLLLCLGSRLDFSMTGFDRTEWAPKASKIVVDIDPSEIAKLEGASNVTPVIANAEDVINALLTRRKEITPHDYAIWKNKIHEWQEKYPVNTREKYTTSDGDLTTYAFVDTLCSYLDEGAYIAPCSSGTTAEIFFQAFTVKPGQTIRSNHGLGSMGFEIPNAIGMCIANGCKPVICIAGDGGMQLNIQELAVIRGRNLPIKIFVINNQGYASIRNMQNNHFNGRHTGCDESSGLYLPDISGLAAAYNIKYLRAGTLEQLDESVKTALSVSCAVLCEIIVNGKCLVTPRTATRVMPDGSMRSSPLENQFPFLSDEEMERNISFLL